MKLFGLTGGIGMGKSAAARILAERGVPVVDTDVLARKVVEPGQPALEEIKQAFGDGLIDSTGQLRRDELAKIVFSDSSAREKLESITHPRIKELWGKEAESWRTRQELVGVIVIPLLFETGAETDLDSTICVACSATTQQKRLAERGWTSEEIAQRINAQWSIEKKIAKANFVVWSEGPLEIVTAQLNKIIPCR